MREYYFRSVALRFVCVELDLARSRREYVAFAYAGEFRLSCPPNLPYLGKITAKNTCQGKFLVVLGLPEYSTSRALQKFLEIEIGIRALICIVTSAK